MNSNKLKHWMLMALSLLAFTSGASARSLNPVVVFFDVCMVSKGKPVQGGAIALKLDMKVASPDDRNNLMLKDAIGSAYVGDGMAITFEASGLCTLFATSQDWRFVHEDLKLALPPSSTSFKVTTELVGETSDSMTMVYHMASPGGPFADWTFSSFNRPGKYNVAISLRMRIED